MHAVYEVQLCLIHLLQVMRVCKVGNERSRTHAWGYTVAILIYAHDNGLVGDIWIVDDL